jgi:TRAP-type uncharacterized transport system substrate-binding protein
MRNLALLGVLLVVLFSCNKDNTRQVSNFGVAIDSMHLNYNQSYVIRMYRNGVLDSDFVIFHPNSTVTEISNRFDSSSYTFPDTTIYTVNTSFDYNKNWALVPGANLFAFYPINDTVNHAHHYVLHDYITSEVVYLYNSINANKVVNIKTSPVRSDSVEVDGTLK